MKTPVYLLCAILSMGILACEDSTSGGNDGGNGDGDNGCTTDAECGDLCCRNNVCVTCEGCGECNLDEDCQGNCMECSNTCCRSFACSSDNDCPPDGDFQRYCPPDPDPELGCRVCEYVRCVSDADCSNPEHPLYIPSCDAGLAPTCSNGLCECGNLCGGDCPDGQFCCATSGSCQPIPDPCPNQNCPECQAPNPNPGGTLNESTCQWENVDCTCMPMPPLPPAFAGLHSAVALGGGIPVLSGYYGEPYGDLIYGVASAAAAGATVEWEFVDGVPSGAPCEGDPQGPRGGIAEPGDDVGWDTDVVVDAAGNPRISYYDRTNGDLKYAAFDGVSWNVYSIDGQGDTGRFTSIVLDSTGAPMIAYMTTRDNLTSYLKLARANSANPMSAADWSLTVADAAPVPCWPDDCAAGQACIKETGLCQTTQDEANCNAGDGCDSGFVCVLGQCWEEAGDPVADDMPAGVGLFASLALYSGNTPAIAYYDSSFGNLKFVYWSGAGFAPPVILAGEDGTGNDLGNLGADASLFIQSDTVHLAYMDADLGDLYYLTFSGQQTGTATVELIDAGARDANGYPTTPGNAVGGFHWVGNYASLLVDSMGGVRVTYQDGTSSDLVYATRGGGGWTVEILAKKLEDAAFDGAYGFFADQVMGTGQAIVSNFKHNLRTDPPSSEIDIRTK